MRFYEAQPFFLYFFKAISRPGTSWPGKFKFIIAGGLFLSCFLNEVAAQQFAANELISLSGYPSNKFDNYVRKKGFKLHSRDAIEDTIKQTYYYDKDRKDSSAIFFISKYQLKNSGPISFQTSSLLESNNLCNQLKEAGYVSAGDASGDASHFYQKDNTTIRFCREMQDSSTLYSYFIEKRNLPTAGNIIFAEDLLCLSSHEYLAAVFGARNVQKDVFYFSESRKKNCSVIFPNTNREAVILWEDELNYRKISAIRIGGSSRTEGSRQNNSPVEQNVWKTHQGIYLGIGLKELERLNGNEINFAGMSAGNAAAPVSKNEGTIDFKKIKLLLNCFNCGDKLYASNLDGSVSGMKDDRKFFVSTIILLPEE